jgi:general secretion pathway protein A
VYKSFFGLKKNPFNINPDPRYLYLTPPMRQALEELTYGIQNRKGLMTLTGEVGTGKTTLVNHLLSWLEHQHARTAFVFNSHLDAKQLFDFILSDFGVPMTAATRENPLLAFNDWLLARNNARELVVLIVDEAQGLPTHVLEEIRLLLNMETPNEKLLQIVLSGQPELEIKLKRPDLVQLQQRIALRCKTAPLTLQETFGYIEDRLHTAGSDAEPIFSPEAVEAVYMYSRGIPRVINLLCENALIAAYADQLRPIPASVVEDAAREYQFDEMRPVAPRLKAIDGHSVAGDLHSLLARIEANAVHLDREINVTKPSPYLVTAENAAGRSQATAFSPASTEARKIITPHVTESPRVAVLPIGGVNSASAQAGLAPWHSRRDSTREQAATYARSCAASLQEAFRQFKNSDFRSAINSTANGLREALRKAELEKKATRTANAIRVGIIRGRVFVSVVVVPSAKVRVRTSRKFATDVLLPGAKVQAANARKSARTWGPSAMQWWQENLCGDKQINSFIKTASILTLLYFLVTRMNPTQSWQSSGLTVLGFVVSLLCVLAVSMGITALVRSRPKWLKDSSEIAASAVRWLKAPIQATQMRGFGPMSEKVQSQRRL